MIVTHNLLQYHENTHSSRLIEKLKRVEETIAEEHCVDCDAVFYGVPDGKGRDYCPVCGKYQLLCNLCTIQPDCQHCPYPAVESE